MGRIARFFAGLAAVVLAIVAVLIAADAVQAHRERTALEAEADALAAAPFVRDPDRPVIVVTGSSTVRLWRSSARTFPEAQVVNTGFGGSTMEALEDHFPGLIKRYDPDQVFIGSGDNDLAAGRSPQQVLAATENLLDRIAVELPEARVAIIAAKPSIRRWYLRDRYEALNAGFDRLAAQRAGVEFVDVWHRLVGPDGQVRPELYADDGLHLNTRGYRIYAAALRAAEDLPEFSASQK